MKAYNNSEIVEKILEQLKKCTDPDLLDLILKLLL
jgi:metal-sulfur cluster biosynthetic enzyme